MQNSSRAAPARIRVTFVLPSLEIGGMERTVVNLVNSLDRSRLDPSLVVYRGKGPLDGELCAEVPRVDLACVRARRSILPFASLLREQRPDIVFSSLRHTNAATVLAGLLARSGAKILLYEAHDVGAAGQGSRLAGRLVDRLYRAADRIVCPSHGVARDCQARTRVAARRMVVLPVPVDIEGIEDQARHLPEDCPLGQRHGRAEIVAAGRLTHQKGFDLLLRAVARPEGRDWNLTILGDGPERGALSHLADGLGIRERVRLPGYVTNPFGWISRADVFVLSSRWEGFGNVIAEAMVCATPVVAARCRSGPDEIIQNGENGLLCDPESADSLADGIRRLLDQPERRRQIVHAARRSVVRFERQAVGRKFSSLLGSIARNDDGSQRGSAHDRSSVAWETSIR